MARLQVKPAAELEDGSVSRAMTLKEYRRTARVLIAAGGPEYISTLARSLNSDQLEDENQLPQQLANSDIILVSVLLENDEVGDGVVSNQTLSLNWFSQIASVSSNIPFITLVQSDL